MAKNRRPTRQANRTSPARPRPLVDLPSRRIQAAQSLWNAGSQTDAISLFAEAIRQEPNNVRAYVMAARAYAESFDFERMEQTHDMLIQRGPRHPGVHHYIGETYLLLKFPDRAIASFELAAKLPDAGPPSWVQLASLYERAHRLDEANELIERAARESFESPLVPLVRSRIQRRQHRPELAEATLHQLIQQLPTESEWACQAWSELAHMKDQQGDFDGAVEAIEYCKRSQRLREKHVWAASESVQARMVEAIDAVSRDDLRRWRSELAHLSPRRVALLTGFPRSGTTLLEQLLDAHPDLVSSEERDFVGKAQLHQFTAKRGKTPLLDILNERPAAELVTARDRYFRAMEYLLGEPVGDRMHLDKNPSYNLTIPLVLRVFPEMRLIVALRDPRDVVISCYLRYLPLNAVSVRFLDLERTAQRFAVDMRAWLRMRELLETPWCEVRYEDTVADAPSQARKALTSLGLKWNPDVLNYRERLSDTKQVTSPSYEAVAQPIYTRAVGRWKNYQKHLEPMLETLEPFLREFGYAS